MANVRAETYRAIQENDLSTTFFSDPFSSVTRQAKRNLLVASLIALAIAILELEITGFLGLQTSTQNLGNLLAQGLAFLIVAYLLISAVFHMYADYSAWQFQRERQSTQPYLELIALVEQQVSVTGEQVKNACSGLRGIVIEGDMRSEVEAEKHIREALSTLESIDEHLDNLWQEVRPLTDQWAVTIRSMDRLNTRLWMRILSLWCLDIVVPVALGLLALWSTYRGVDEVIRRLLG